MNALHVPTNVVYDPFTDHKEVLKKRPYKGKNFLISTLTDYVDPQFRYKRIFIALVSGFFDPVPESPEDWKIFLVIDKLLEKSFCLEFKSINDVVDYVKENILAAGNKFRIVRDTFIEFPPARFTHFYPTDAEWLREIGIKISLNFSFN